MNLDQYTAPFVAGFSLPSQRQPANKSRKGTHKTYIQDDRRIGPKFEALVQYRIKHTPALDDFEIEVLSTIAVYSVVFEYQENGRSGGVPDAMSFNERLACRHCDWLLNEESELEGRIQDEILLAILAE